MGFSAVIWAKPEENTGAEAEPVVLEPPEAPSVSNVTIEGEVSTPSQPYVEPTYSLAVVPSTRRKKTSIFAPLAIVFVALIVAALAADFLLPKKSTPAVAFQDLGSGISKTTGLKGNLQVRWQNATAQYQVEFEPLNSYESAGFSAVATNPPSQLYINVKVLDAAGFAMCGKQILFPYNASNQSGKDVFQNTAADDGKVMSINAQGVLPCSPDQLRQASYWDFTTNFPTRSEQKVLLSPPETTEDSTQQAAQSHSRRRQVTRPAAFSSEGDDRVADYDSSRGVLEAQYGHEFLVSRLGDRAVADAWASGGSLFHYRCDQHSQCALTGAGGRETIYVQALQ